MITTSKANSSLPNNWPLRLHVMSKCHAKGAPVNVLINRFQPFEFCEQLRDVWQTAGANNLISSYKVMYLKCNQNVT